MFNKIKSLWSALIKTQFNKKFRKVRKNTLNENIFEISGRIDNR